MFTNQNPKRWLIGCALGGVVVLCLCAVSAWVLSFGGNELISRAARPPAPAPEPRVAISAQNAGKLEALYQFAITDTVKGNQAINVVSVLAWSPDSRWLAIGSEGGIGIPSQSSLRLWDVVKGNGRVLYSSLEHGFGLNGQVAFLPDGQTLAYQTGTSITFWDVPHERELRTQQYTSRDEVNAAFFLAATGREFPDMSRVREAAYLQPGDEKDPENFGFSPDWKMVAVNELWDASDFSLYDVTSGQVVQKITGSPPSVFSHNGRIIVSRDRDYYQSHNIAIADYQAPVILSDVETGQVLQRLVGDVGVPPRSFMPFDFSPDDSLLVAAGRVGWNGLGSFLPQRQVYIWDTHSGRRHELNGAHGNADAVAFSPDGRFLATGWSDGTVQLWGIRP